MNFVVGTTNPGEIGEIAAILRPMGCGLTPSEPFDVPETEATVAGNARLKAAACARRAYDHGRGASPTLPVLAGDAQQTTLPRLRLAIAEDSGLSVAALYGLPGPWSARFSECEIDLANGAVLGHAPSSRDHDAIDAANNARVLELLRDLPQHRRAAELEVALAVAAPDGAIVFEAGGTAAGWIAEAPRGEHGCGYEPIFVGHQTGGATFAELDAARQNIRSPRREALRQFTIWLGRTLRRRQELRVVVDGNDGTGKTTLVASLRALGYTVQDRGLPTKLSDGPDREPLPEEIFLILDAPVEVSRERLRAAGKDLEERYHTEADLAHYRGRFLAIAGSLPGAHLIASIGSADETLGQVLRVLMA